MLRWISHQALRLDEWLQATLGRPYNALLGVGLIVEIVRHLYEMPKRLADVHRLVPTLLVMAMEVALLIHQVGALHHHLPKLRRQRGRRGGRGEPPEAESEIEPEPVQEGLTPPPPAA
jgi:hypothetical protein